MDMKKVNLYLNIILGIAIAVLFYLHFSKPATQTTVESPKESSFKGVAQDLSVAYINIDTLLENYDHYFDLRNKLLNKQKESETELNSKAKAFEDKYIDFQNKVQKGLITRSTAREMEQQLSIEQENLMKLRNDLTQELAEEEVVMNRKMIYEIMEFLKEYNEQYNYQFILSNSFGGTLLYADKQMNITREVIEGLNARYRNQK